MYTSEQQHIDTREAIIAAIHDGVIRNGTIRRRDLFNRLSHRRDLSTIYPQMVAEGEIIEHGTGRPRDPATVTLGSESGEPIPWLSRIPRSVYTHFLGVCVSHDIEPADKLRELMLGFAGPEFDPDDKPDRGY